MRFERFSFGSIRIDGVTHKYDVIDRGTIRKRKKKPSKTFRDAFGHTPLSVEEKIPWKCRRLVIGLRRRIRRIIHTPKCRHPKTAPSKCGFIFPKKNQS